jgi:hypothetical protein
MEFGHTIMSPIAPNNPGAGEEAQLHEFLIKKLYVLFFMTSTKHIYNQIRYNGEHPLEYEDIVSGRGLVATYEWAVQGHDEAPKNLNAAEIVEHAFKVCDIKKKILLFFFTPFFFVGATVTLRHKGFDAPLQIFDANR